jgi:endoglucanase
VNEKKIALEFTGHTFAEGGETILNELAGHHAHASFFLTGDFLTNPDFAPLVRRIIREGHYLGPHSDKHLLYCPWDGPKKTLLTHEVFDTDLKNNLAKIPKGAPPVKFWLPAYEWYNGEIVGWSRQLGLTLVNFTPGTRSNADYTEDDDKHFVSSQAIFESIVKKEHTDPHGLNGFLLLLHVGVGPHRTDKFHQHFGGLVNYLSDKGYQFVRVDELLEAHEK